MKAHENSFPATPARPAPPLDPAHRHEVEGEPELPRGPARSFDADALTRALRVAGAGLVVASASTFMLQHWQGGNDLAKYAMLVGQSLLLAAAAYFVGLTLREGRSARTFLALVLATMPVSFAVLGGLVYSRFHVEAVAPLPTYATWVAPTPAAALLAVLGTLVVLVPLSTISFMALARKEAKVLTLAFFVANLLVLIPVRQPLTVAVMAGVALLTLLRLELAYLARVAQLDTLEGKLARSMPFAAPLIMLGRVFHLYEPSAAYLGAVLLIAAAALWLLLGRAADSRRDLGSWLSAVLAVLGWGLCWAELAGHVGSAALSVLLFGLPMAGMGLLASVRATASRRNLVAISTVAALLTVVGACAVDFGTIAAFGCILFGVAVAVWGASVRAIVRTLMGSGVALFGLGVQVWLAVHHDNVLRWASLSVAGVLLIVGSAYLERHRGRLLRYWDAAALRRQRQREALQL